MWNKADINHKNAGNLGMETFRGQCHFVDIFFKKLHISWTKKMHIFITTFRGQSI